MENDAVGLVGWREGEVYKQGGRQEEQKNDKSDLLTLQSTDAPTFQGQVSLLLLLRPPFPAGAWQRMPSE